MAGIEKLREVLEDRSATFMSSKEYPVCIADTLAFILADKRGSLQNAIRVSSNGGLIRAWTAEVEMIDELLKGTIMDIY